MLFIFEACFYLQSSFFGCVCKQDMLLNKMCQYLPHCKLSLIAALSVVCTLLKNDPQAGSNLDIKQSLSHIKADVFSLGTDQKARILV